MQKIILGGLNKREALNSRFVYPSKEKRLINQLERSPAVRASSKKRFIALFTSIFNKRLYKDNDKKYISEQNKW